MCTPAVACCLANAPTCACHTHNPHHTSRNTVPPLRSVLTDDYLRVKGSDGSIFAIGDSSTIFQPKAMERAEELFDEADIDKDEKLTIKELRNILKKVRHALQCAGYNGLGMVAENSGSLCSEC